MHYCWCSSNLVAVAVVVADLENPLELFMSHLFPSVCETGKVHMLNAKLRRLQISELK